MVTLLGERTEKSNKLRPDALVALVPAELVGQVEVVLSAAD